MNEVAAHLAWAKGGTARFVDVADDAVTLRSTIPSPPGSRLDATLCGEPAPVIKIKIHSSKREEDGSYTLKGRLLEATRSLRDQVAKLEKL